MNVLESETVEFSTEAEQPAFFLQLGIPTPFSKITGSTFRHIASGGVG